MSTAKDSLLARASTQSALSNGVGLDGLPDSSRRLRSNTASNNLRKASVVSESDEIRRMSYRTCSTAMVRERIEEENERLDDGKRRSSSESSESGKELVSSSSVASSRSGSTDDIDDEEDEPDAVEMDMKKYNLVNQENVLYGIHKENGSRKLFAGSFEVLVDEMINIEIPNPDYMFAFLLSFRSFGKPVQLLGHLVKRFETTAPESLSKADQIKFNRKTLIPLRLRITNVLKTWINDHFSDFRDDEQLLQAFYDFTDGTMYQSGMVKPADLLQKLMQRKLSEAIMDQEEPYSWAGNVLETFQGSEESSSSSSKESSSLSGPGTIRIPNVKFTRFRALQSRDKPKPILPKKKRNKPLSLLHIAPEEMARQLTLLEHRMFLRLKPSEFMNTSWNTARASTQAPNIMAMIKQFNIVSQWVATEIVLEVDDKKRTAVLKFFIELAKYTYELRNFNTTMEIVSGLLISPVWRLKPTWESLSEDVLVQFDRLSALMSSRKDHQRLRTEMSVAVTPCIMFIGLVLGDILSVDSLPSETENGLINFDKHARTCALIRDLHQNQFGEYNFEPVKPILTFLKDAKIVEDDVLSQESEKRLQGKGRREELELMTVDGSVSF
eukprot:TRINITY_DN13386_c0_g1_i3.p1 TRINITY_DN13386_c0_g1~~TRINITY_DN13386_c0_g1_i3.p1  ORF type:complete len:611 (+),score=174.63 TRINITY_DN13386_c0_g1_i3:1044-2876(+)